MSRKTFIVIAGLMMFSLVFGFPLSVFAATVTFDADTTLTLPNGTSLTIISGGLVESIVVNDDSTVTVTTASDTDITFQSDNVYKFINSGANVTSSCVGGSYSRYRLIYDGDSSEIFSVSGEAACTASGSGGSSGGGGGGGGAGTPPAAPTNTSVSIKNGDAST